MDTPIIWLLSMMLLITMLGVNFNKIEDRLDSIDDKLSIIAEELE